MYKCKFDCRGASIMRKRSGDTEIRVGLDPMRTEPPPPLATAVVAVEVPPAVPAADAPPFNLSELRRAVAFAAC
jgi:hypothetical protein